MGMTQSACALARHVRSQRRPLKINRSAARLSWLLRQELRQFEELKTVAQVTVVRLPEGWLLIVGVEGRARDLVVWSTRQRPRLWKSLDKLVSYAIDVVPSVPTFELMLGPPEDWDVEVRPKQKPGRAASGREP
jgi:hypothetical protein